MPDPLERTTLAELLGADADTEMALTIAELLYAQIAEAQGDDVSGLREYHQRRGVGEVEFVVGKSPTPE